MHTSQTSKAPNRVTYLSKWDPKPRRLGFENKGTTSTVTSASKLVLRSEVKIYCITDTKRLGGRPSIAVLISIKRSVNELEGSISWRFLSHVEEVARNDEKQEWLCKPRIHLYCRLLPANGEYLVLSESSLGGFNDMRDWLQNALIIKSTKSCTTAPTHLLQHGTTPVLNSKLLC